MVLWCYGGVSGEPTSPGSKQPINPAAKKLALTPIFLASENLAFHSLLVSTSPKASEVDLKW
jgi:hypothetical protein